MSFIFKGVDSSGKDIWGTLLPPTVNEVWELTTWDEIKRDHVVDKGPNGRLTYMGTRPGLKSNQEDGRYVGEIPSQAAVNHINWLKDKLKFFDDGKRAVYGGPDRDVTITPVDVIHPISYPPAGFKLETDEKGAHQWVAKRSKYE